MAAPEADMVVKSPAQIVAGDAVAVTAGIALTVTRTVFCALIAPVVPVTV